MYYFGIDLGGTNISAGLVDENYKIISKKSCKTNVPRSEAEICDDMAKLFFDILTETGVTSEQISSVGIGSPGAVNKKSGVVEFANNLFFHNWNLQKMMENRLNKKVFIENDANVAAFGEFIAGAAQNTKSSITITIGTGIGSGIILDGKIYDGINYNAAELGHMVIVPNGRLCSCGRRGCFEKYASASGLILTTKEYLKNTSKSDTIIWSLIENNINNVSARTAFTAMKSGDVLGEKIVNEYCEYLSLGIVNIINIFQPEIICIGGGVCNEGDLLLAPIRKVIEKERYSKYAKEQTKLCSALLGNDAGIIGAALLGCSCL